MRVHLAKYIYDDRTIAFLIERIADSIEETRRNGTINFDRSSIKGKCFRDSGNKEDPFTVKCGNKKQIHFGRFDHIVALFKRQYTRGGLSTDTVEDIFALEYMVQIHELFNNIFLNKDCAVTLQNFTQLQSCVSMRLKYLSNWMGEGPTHIKIDNRTKEHMRCMSSITWANLQVMASGFFEFAKYLLNQSHVKVNYVPMLFCTSSTIESFFSTVRRLNHDRPETVTMAFMRSNTLKVKEVASKKANVNEEDLECRTKARFIDTDLITKKQKERKEFVSFIVDNLNAVNRSHSVQTMIPEALKRIKNALLVQFVEENGCMFKSDDLLRDMLLHNYGKKWLHLLAKNTMASNTLTFLVQNHQNIRLKFNDFGNNIMCGVLQCLEQTLDARAASRKKNPYEYRFFKYQWKDDLKRKFKSVMSNRNDDWLTYSCIIGIIEFVVLDNFFSFIRDQIEAVMVEEVLDEDKLLKKVNGFVGYGFFRLQRKLQEHQKSSLMSSYSSIEVKQASSIVSSMQLDHIDAIQDKVYMSKYYKKSLEVKNMGFLYLLPTNVIQTFGNPLLQTIHRHMNMNQIALKGGDTAKEAHKQLRDNVELQASFNQLIDQYADSDEKLGSDSEIREAMYIFLTQKVFNAYTGESIKLFEDKTGDTFNRLSCFRQSILCSSKSSKKKQKDKKP